MTNTALIAAAQAVVDRWDTPAWKDVEHTAVFINRLRASLTTAAAAAKESLTVAHALPPGIARDDTVHGEMYYTAAQMRAMHDTDQRMLEMAAKAMGWTRAEFQDMRGWGEVRHGFSEAMWVPEIGEYWNPRTDDGDALRLAAKLRMEIEHNHPADEPAWVSARAFRSAFVAVEKFEDEVQRLPRQTACWRMLRGIAGCGSTPSVRSVQTMARDP